MTLPTCSDPPLNFVTDCQPTPFNLQLLRGALKDMRKDNPELHFIPGDDWTPTFTRYLWCEELEERLGAYFEISVQYGKCLFELEAAQLIMDTDERHRLEYSLELLMRHITNRIDEILSILARDNMLRKKGKKRVYTLPRVNPRVANINSTEDAWRMGKEIEEDIMEILITLHTHCQKEKMTDLEYATMDQTSLMTTQEDHVTQEQTKVLPTTTYQQEQHRNNFDDRDQHRTNTIQDMQQRLTQMAQEGNSANTENVRHVWEDRPNDNTQNSRRWRNMLKDTSIPKHRTTNPTQGASLVPLPDWNGCWTAQECSACGQEGHNARGCRARQNNELFCTRCNRSNHCNNTCRLPP